MTFQNRYIKVAIALPVYNTYTYEVPEHLAENVSVGKRVLVPFARRRVTGYIMGPSEDIDYKEMKCILDILDEWPLFPSSLLPFFKWIADYYMHPIGEVIRSALPGGINLYEFASIAITEKGEKALLDEDLLSNEHEVLEQLKDGPVRIKDLCRNFKRDIRGACIQTLEKKGWIVRNKELKSARTRPRMERYVSLIKPVVSFESLSKQRQKIIEALSSNREISLKDLKKLAPTAANMVRSIQRSGYVKIYEKRVYRDPFGESITPDTAPELTDEQTEVVSAVLKSLGEGFSTFLLAGVTGSGKTEVYLQLAAAAVKLGYSVLVLVPEIALISQIERRFRSRFGECIAVLHSGLSAGERYDQWMRILRGDASIVIGARSAIFAPLARIGLIVVDEEHDTSYKQERGLRYNARDIAVVRAKQEQCTALLGSATPSVQSYYNVATKKFVELKLESRVENQSLPEVTVVDLSDIRDMRGVRRFISIELLNAMRETLGRQEQVLLFLNRRGFAGLPICSACGEAVRCRDCDISLTLHQQANAYRCHYCGFTRAFSSRCDNCGSANIRLLGLGTEKVEAAVKALFPDARIARMDRDTTAKKGAIIKILKGLRNQTIDVLIGTQMIAKGHDFPNITLVGIICADLSLSFPDFRAGERAFQLLAQVSGRAGRGNINGKVILQTYNPNHFSILSAKDQDFKKFYKKEIAFRKALNYPPYSRIIQFKISGKHKAKTGQVALALGNACSVLLRDRPSLFNSLEILGPIPAPLTRIAKQYRWQLLLKGRRVRTLHRFVYQLVNENISIFSRTDTQVAIDVDPFFMM